MCVRTSLYIQKNIYLLIIGVLAQVSNSRENSVPPAVQTIHGTNISNIEVSFITLLLSNVKIVKLIILIRIIENNQMIMITYYLTLQSEKEERLVALTPSEEYQLLIKR